MAARSELLTQIINNLVEEGWQVQTDTHTLSPDEVAEALVAMLGNNAVLIGEFLADSGRALECLQGIAESGGTVAQDVSIAFAARDDLWHNPRLGWFAKRAG